MLVSPHPDDEVLAFGGLLQSLLRLRLPLLLISVTDGEACYPGSVYWSPAHLGEIRIAETENALRRLGWLRGEFDWVEIGLRDTAVQSQEAELRVYLENHLESGDVILTSWRHDGHSDHEAVGRACAAAAAACGVKLYEAPVWALHWGQPGDARLPWERLRILPLTQAQRLLKHNALRAFESQLIGDPLCRIAPILSPSMLKRACLPYEVIFL